jgi:hypothetical protein
MRVSQGYTHMTDETSSQSFPATADTLFNAGLPASRLLSCRLFCLRVPAVFAFAALGSSQFFGAFMTNLHADSAGVGSEQQNGDTIVTAGDWANFARTCHADRRRLLLRTQP